LVASSRSVGMAETEKRRTSPPKLDLTLKTDMLVGSMATISDLTQNEACTSYDAAAAERKRSLLLLGGARMILDQLAQSAQIVALEVVEQINIALSVAEPHHGELGHHGHPLLGVVLGDKGSLLGRGR